jgi:hypothetical protein
MKRLPPPTFDEAEVYNACAGDVPGAQLEEAYAAAAGAMKVSADQYRIQAVNCSLHTLPASNWGNDDQVVVGNLMKGDLKKLYDRGMLHGAGGRSYYDKILASAPLGKCPYCRFGHAETLDHFLSKSRYPSYAVLPCNLIPACMRCNKGKGGGVLTAEDEMSHPYFEVQQVEQDVWLEVELMETNPATAKYSIAIPVHWPDDLSHRVTNYFSEFDLAVRYAVEAASELVSVSAYLRALPTPNLRREHLQRVAGEERGISRNGWKAALYAALGASNWYSDLGYSLIGMQ